MRRVVLAALAGVAGVAGFGLAPGCSRPAHEGASRVEGRPAPARDAASAPAPRTAPAEATTAAVPDAVTAAAPDAGPAATGPVIVEAPVRWTEERAQLTLAYRRAHSDAEAQDLAIEPRVIVLHYTGGNSAAGTRAYFDHVKIEAARKQLRRAGLVNVSAHYLVDRDGTIYRLQPETRFARHCIGLNHVAIGVENVGDGAQWPLTVAQVAANAALVRELARRFPITHLLGHHEVMAFRGHAYYRELDDSYRNTKPDPGAAFMQRVRAELVDLQLAGP